MSQDFKLKFDQVVENTNVYSFDMSSANHSELQNSYSSASNMRNICFSLKDGRRIFLNYSYLMACEFISEESKILLSFTSHVVVLKGEQLQQLFEGLFFNTLMNVSEKEERYDDIEKRDGCFVRQILIDSE